MERKWIVTLGENTDQHKNKKNIFNTNMFLSWESNRVLRDVVQRPKTGNVECIFSAH